MRQVQKQDKPRESRGLYMRFFFGTSGEEGNRTPIYALRTRRSPIELPPRGTLMEQHKLAYAARRCKQNDENVLYRGRIVTP